MNKDPQNVDNHFVNKNNCSFYFYYLTIRGMLNC